MKLRVKQVGDGPGVPVLLLHGFTGSAEAWPPELLAGLGRERVVFVVDLPGHGESPDPDPDLDETVVAALDALVGVLDARGVERADWVGYSMGGRLALAGAVEHPARVRRLVLESASPGIESLEERARRRTEDDALARRIETQGLEWFVDEWMANPLFETQGRLPEEVLRGERDRRLRNRIEGLAAALRSFGPGVQPPYWGRLWDLAATTLVLTGGLDQKFVAIGERMVRKLNRAVHEVIPEVGHAVHREAPEAWLEVVVPFLDGPGR